MTTGKAVQGPFSKGVNLTNWLEYRPAKDINPTYYTKQDFENVKRLGCDVVRLPIHFERICEGVEDMTIPDKIWNILDEVAVWAEELKLYVIYDFHNATHVDSQTQDDVENVLRPIWTQLANRYKDASDYIVYELMNEPHGIEVPLWNEVIAKIFKLVRDIDKKHYIIVGGADWNSFAAMKTLPDFKDDKVIYTFHFYDPHTFTHQGAMWCHMERVVGIPFPYDPEKMPPLPENPTDYEREKFENYSKQGTLEATVAFFDQYVEFSRERNAPVFCGEFGAYAPCMSQQQRVAWYEIITDLLEEKGISRTSWDYYGPFGVYDINWKEVREKRMFPELKFPENLNKEICKALHLNYEF